MKQFSKAFGAALILTSIFVLSFSFVLVSAGETSKTIQVDLSKPPQPAAQSDPFNEKYEEVLSELSISEEAAQVVEQIKGVVEGLSDLGAQVCITEIRDRRNEEVRVNLLVSVEHKLARLEFAEPSALRGMIVVADQEEMELRIFQPVVNMITIQTMEDASKEALSALNLSQVTSYFDFSQYNVELLEVEELEGVTTYLLAVDAPDEQIWQVRVSDDSWIPHQITVYEGEVLLGTMTLTQVVTDQGLSEEDLADLPDVKVERL